MTVLLLAPPLISGKEFFRSHLELHIWIEKVFTIRIISSAVHSFFDLCVGVFEGFNDVFDYVYGALGLFIVTQVKAMFNIGDSQIPLLAE